MQESLEKSSISLENREDIELKNRNNLKTCCESQSVMQESLEKSSMSSESSEDTESNSDYSEKSEDLKFKITDKLKTYFGTQSFMQKSLEISSISSLSAISIIGSFPDEKKNYNYRRIDEFITNLIRYVRLSKVGCIITDAKKYNEKVSFAEMIEQKVQENPYYSNDYKNEINLIGVTSLDSLDLNETSVRHLIIYNIFFYIN
jgi:hypothetical protein